MLIALQRTWTSQNTRQGNTGYSRCRQRQADARKETRHGNNQRHKARRKAVDASESQASNQEPWGAKGQVDGNKAKTEFHNNSDPTPAKAKVHATTDANCLSDKTSRATKGKALHVQSGFGEGEDERMKKDDEHVQKDDEHAKG